MPLGLLFLISLILSLKFAYNEPNTCSMSWSRPVYHPITVVAPKAKKAQKYGIFLYREGGASRKFVEPSSLGGTPILFLPGNAGSYNQGRSFAARSAVVTKETDSSLEFDWFLADFDEDLSAMHGRTLLDEAEYVNEAIQHILSLYSDFETPPTSVILVCHSMGGIVARLLPTLSGYKPGSINTIITLSTPHAIPPLTWDRDITGIYDIINQHWRIQPEKDISLVSIAGGHADLMVVPDYTSVESIRTGSNALTAFSYSIPGVWKGIDHLAVVWCAELRDAVTDCLFSMADPSSASRTLPLEERMEKFSRRLQTPLDNILKDGDTIIFNSESPRSFSSPVGEMSLEASNYSTAENEEKVDITRLQVTGWPSWKLRMTSRFVDIALQDINSSLIALRLNGQGVEAFRHVFPGTGDSRWYNGDSASVVWYSRGPYVPYDPSYPEHLHIQAIGKPDALIEISIDWISTLANIATRYRTLVAVWPLAITLVCLAMQLGTKPVSFKVCFSAFMSLYFWYMVIGLTILHLLLGIPLVRDSVRALQFPSEKTNMMSLKHVGFDINELLLGTSLLGTAIVPFFLLSVATSAVFLLDKVAAVIVYFNRFHNFHLPKRIPLWFWCVLLTGLLFVPFQVTTVAFALLQLLATRGTQGWHYTFSLVLCWIAIIDAPILLVWMRNLTWKWAWAFATVRNVIAAAPIVIFVWIKPDKIPLRYMRFTKLILAYTVIYSLLYGFMHTFVLHHLISYFCGWVLVLLLEKKTRE